MIDKPDYIMTSEELAEKAEKIEDNSMRDSPLAGAEMIAVAIYEVGTALVFQLGDIYNILDHRLP